IRSIEWHEGDTLSVVATLAPDEPAPAGS
ncbi:MAG: hypothetical protein RJB65_2511, partial [Actinomycetota bacterium]